MSEAREKARALLASATPWPWISTDVEDDGGGIDIHLITREANGDEVAALVEYDGSASNAALIAAAPGLLAALCDENDALRAEAERLKAKLAGVGESGSAQVVEFTLEDDTDGPDDGCCAVVAEAVGAAMYRGSGKAERMDPDVPGAYICRAGFGGCRMYILGNFYQLVTDFPTPAWVAPWLVARFRARIHIEEGGA